MPSPDSSTWQQLFAGEPDLPVEKLRWWLSDRLDCFLTALPLSARPVPEELQAFREAVRRLRAGEPVQYICGRAAFRNLTLRISPAVLIPRPETEQLVQLALDRVLRPGDRILDVGTGSGCIALSVKQEAPGSCVEGIDLSSDAVAIARENARIHELEISFREADLLSHEPESAWDVILSNPPYIAETEKLDLPVEVRDFEPAEALFSGKDGLEHIRRLLGQARTVLRPHGRILLEAGETQGMAIRRLATDLGYTHTSLQDLAGRERFHLLTRSADTTVRN